MPKLRELVQPCILWRMKSHNRTLSEVVAEKPEKLLPFTQFKEITAPLKTFLADVFGRPGRVTHGGTPVKKRGKARACLPVMNDCPSSCPH